MNPITGLQRFQKLQVQTPRFQNTKHEYKSVVKLLKTQTRHNEFIFRSEDVNLVTSSDLTRNHVRIHEKAEV